MNKVVKRRALLVCQAPVEVPNILKFYEEIKGEYFDITFVSRDTNSYNEFFQYIGVNANFVRWENNGKFDSLRPWTWINFKKQIRKNLAGMNLDNCDVFYSSRYDFFSYCHFKRFPNSTRFIYRDKKDSEVWCNKGEDRTTLKIHIKRLLDRYIKQWYCGIKLRYDNCGSISILGFDPNKIGHTVRKKLSDDEEKQIIKKYTYKPNVVGIKNVVFFTEPYRNRFHDQNDYISMNIRIVNELHKKGYKVILKGHPRLGICEEIKQSVDDVIPNFIPSEFINYADFDFAIGFVSTALCGTAGIIPTYSVLDMCLITDKHLADYWRSFINRNSNDSVIFLRDFSKI